VSSTPGGQTHDIKSLFVSDGSAFSPPGCANPTLTIVALALRQAEYISREMAAKDRPAGAPPRQRRCNAAS